MPLTMAPAGTVSLIKKVGGRGDTKHFLESLGFVAGGHVTVIAESSGGVIVSVKDARVAISREMANKIIV